MKKFRFPVIMREKEMEMEIEYLSIKTRALHVLKRAHIFTIGDLVRFVTRSDDLRTLPGCGDDTVKDIMGALFEFEMEHAPDPDAYARKVIELMLEDVDEDMMEECA